MNVSKENLDKSQIKLTIELTQDEYLPFLEKAARELSEKVDIPGFRKGQASLDIVKKHVGEMTVYQEASQFAVDKTLHRVILDEKLETVGQPQINVEKLAPNNPFIYTAIIPLVPEVKLPDINKIKIKKETHDVSEQEVEKVLENLQKMRAKEKLVDRVAAVKDKVEINFKVFLNKIPIDGGTSDKYPLVLGENSMIPGFEDQIIGMKKDEEKEFSLTFPKDYHSKQLAGKECEFKVKLLAVYEMELPELNDEFAKTVGEQKSLDELKKAIKESIQKEKDDKADRDFEMKILETLIKDSQFGDLPEVLLTRETQAMMQELEQNVLRQGLKFEDYLMHLKKDRKQLLLDFTPDAIKRIKSSIIIRALAKQEQIKETEEEFREELDRNVHMYQNNESLLKHINSPGYKDYLRNVICNRKTIHWLKDQVKS